MYNKIKTSILVITIKRSIFMHIFPLLSTIQFFYMY